MISIFEKAQEALRGIEIGKFLEEVGKMRKAGDEYRKACEEFKAKFGIEPALLMDKKEKK